MQFLILASFPVVNPTWTDEEKKQLLEALEKFGGGDITKLATAVPTKTRRQIKIALDVYLRKNYLDLKGGRKDKVPEAPVDLWLRFLEQQTPESCRAAGDLAIALKFIALFEKRVNMEDVVLRDCYEYLSNVAAGKPPKKLNTESLHFFMENFATMAKNMRYEDRSKPMEFIQTLKVADIVEKSDDSKNASTASISVFNPLNIPPELLQLDEQE